MIAFNMNDRPGGTRELEGERARAMTTTTKMQWTVNNGSGWNHHITADRLSEMLAQSPEDLTESPVGYEVCVAPVSDKPLGLRCALVRVLPRKMAATIDYHVAAGNYVDAPNYRALSAGESDGIESIESARADLIRRGYVPSDERPAGWPTGREWFRAANGEWASIEMLDDGCDGEASDWVRDQFGFDGEIIKSVREDEQTSDASAYFIRKMTEAIDALEIR